MPTFLRAALVAAALVSAHSVALACSCTIPDPDPSGYAAVFVGEARGGGALGCGGVDGSVTTRFEVTEAFAGVEAGDVVEVEHAVDSAACGVTFEPGETYLVYAYEGDEDLSTGLCAPGGPVADQGALLEELRGGR
jgi:hypothetical protein